MVRYNDKPVIQYNYGVTHKEGSESDLYDRASYIHPVWTPSGKVITEDFSPEYANLKGIFHSWKKLKFRDTEVSFWDLCDKTGRKLPDELGPTVFEVLSFQKLIFTAEEFTKEILSCVKCPV